MGSFVFISGAAGGLGTAMAHECARRGFNLYLSDRSEHPPAYAAQLAVRYAIEVRYHSCELTSRGSRSALFAALEEEGCRFFGLINVAGRDYEGAFLQRTRDQVLHLSELIITANLDLTHQLLQMCDPTRRFMLINIGSLAAFFPMPYKATYSSSKRFLLNFSLALREEIKDFGDVLILCPAGLPTHAESQRKMKAQGFWGRATMTDTTRVARLAIDRALKGRALYVPGLLNPLLACLGALLPASLLTRFLGRRWQARQGWAAVDERTDHPV